MSPSLLKPFLTLMLVAPFACDSVEVRLVDAAGKPAQWGQNTVPFGNPPKTGAVFTVEMGYGSLLAAGMYLVHRDSSGIHAFDPEVTIDKDTVTLNVDAIDKSLRCATALAWASGTLYVAEIHSNDDVDRYVYAVKPDGALGQRFTTVANPGAIVVSADTLYVLGSTELAAYQLADGSQRWIAPANSMWPWSTNGATWRPP